MPPPLKKIVITGALGHIGSAILHRMTPGRYSEVLLLDNLLTQRYGSLFGLPREVPFRFLEGDILDPGLEDRFRGAHAVIHLAAITNAPASFGNEAEVERVNYEGTARVARACATTGSRLVYLSTTSVYGSQQSVVDEECPLEELKPQSPYAESKLLGERYLEQLGRESGLRFITCRFGTIFGPSPGMRFHTAVNKFIWQACMGQPVTVWKTALDQKRPYLDLEDAVSLLEFVLERDLFDGRIYNVVTINETVGGILAAIRRHIPNFEVKFVDSPIMNQLSYTVRSDRIREKGFLTRGNLDAAVATTISLLQGVRTEASAGGKPPPG